MHVKKLEGCNKEVKWRKVEKKREKSIIIPVLSHAISADTHTKSLIPLLYPFVGSHVPLCGWLAPDFCAKLRYNGSFKVLTRSPHTTTTENNTSVCSFVNISSRTHLIRDHSLHWNVISLVTLQTQELGKLMASSHVTVYVCMSVHIEKNQSKMIIWMLP